MKDFKELIDYYCGQYESLVKNSGTDGAAEAAMPGKAYFLEDGSILCLPREDGDNRFPYGSHGFNFWTYASGYMHANEGLFSPFLRAGEGQEPKIAFFAGWKGKDEYAVLPLLGVPKTEADSFPEAVRFTVFTKTGTYYITQAGGIRFAVRVFVDEENLIYFSLHIHNLSVQVQKLYVSAYFNPFLCSGIHESSENRWYRKAEFLEGSDINYSHFIFRINEDLSRTLSVTNFGVLNRCIKPEGKSRLIRQEATTSRYQYVGGALSSLHTAKALKQGHFDVIKHVTAFNETAAAGEILHLELEPEEPVRLEYNLGYQIHCRNTESCRGLLCDPKPEESDRCIAQLAVKEDMEDRSLKVIFGESLKEGLNGRVLTDFFSYLKKQVEFCSKIKGYVQLSEGSLIGIRDVFQALEGMLYYRPEEAKDKILEALGFIFTNGRCPRQYTLPVSEHSCPVMDLRQFIDQGVWVIDTIIAYLKFTGDFTFLEQSCGYYEIADEAKKTVKKSDLKESVLMHMLRIMDYLIQNRDPVTGCIRALYGDWNDALDGLGVSSDVSEEFGSGVSVMVTLQVYHNLTDLVELLNRLEGYQGTIQDYRSIRDEIGEALFKYAVIKDAEGKRRIVHGWGDRRSYYVGSFNDPDGKSRFGLTSNAFWVIGGLYKKDTTFKDTILSAFEHLDSGYGLKTFEPFFEPGTPGVGRIYKLPPGTAENGAVYIHAAAFGIMALFMIGESEKAWGQLMKIFPFTHRHISCSPYVMPNSYGENKALNVDGESMLDWQTGSSNVVLKLLIRFVFGFQPEYGGFFLQPAAPIPFREFQLDINYQGCEIHISYRNNNEGERSYHVNDVWRQAVKDEDMGIDKLWVDRQEIQKDTWININE